MTVIFQYLGNVTTPAGTTIGDTAAAPGDSFAHVGDSVSFTMLATPDPGISVNPNPPPGGLVPFSNPFNVIVSPTVVPAVYTWFYSATRLSDSAVSNQHFTITVLPPPALINKSQLLNGQLNELWIVPSDGTVANWNGGTKNCFVRFQGTIAASVTTSLAAPNNLVIGYWNVDHTFRVTSDGSANLVNVNGLPTSVALTSADTTMNAATYSITYAAATGFTFSVAGLTATSGVNNYMSFDLAVFTQDMSSL